MSSPLPPVHRERSTSIPAVLVRIIVLGAVLAVTAFTVPLMIQQQQWMWLAVMVLAAIAIFVIYSTKR